MRNKYVTYVTVTFAALIVVLIYFDGFLNTGQAINNAQNTDLQGVVGIILLLMLVISIFFVAGNVRMMLDKNFHKK